VLYAVDEAGNSVWDVTLDGQIAASPATSNGAVYFVTEAGNVLARQVSDNSPLWEQTIDGQLLTDPIVVDATLLVAALNGEALLTAFNTESGAIRWTYQPAEE
jgi:outer membrane protein assembly factor BamB